MNRPKAHHFVPQNQQRRFQDEEGNLFLGIKEQNKVIPVSTYSAMQQSELYSTLVTEPMEGKDNRYDSRLEQDFFAPLDGQWAAMCDEILDITADGNLPEMDESTRRAFAQYVYNAYTRVPEVHQRSSVHQDPEGALRDILGTELSDSPRRAEFQSRITDPAFRTRVVKNATVRAIAQQNHQAIDDLARCSFSWLMPARPEDQFLIGSVPVVLKPTENIDPFDLGIIFPIAKRLCLEIRSEPEDEMCHISGRLVDEINLRSARQSRFCLGPASSAIERAFALLK